MSEDMVFIGDLDESDVLAALYNASRPQGLGFLHYDPTPMKSEEAGALLKHAHYFDYLKGRVMKGRLDDDWFRSWGYDRDNGVGMAQKVVDQVRDRRLTQTPEIAAAHRIGLKNAAKEAQEALTKDHSVRKEGDITWLNLGLSDVADALEPAIDQAVQSGSEGGSE